MACVGFLLSIGAFYVSDAWENARVRAELEQRASDSASIIQVGIGLNLEVVFSLRDLYATDETVDRRVFRSFAQGILERHSEIQALEWIPRVAGSERAAYISAARSEGFFDFQFTESSEQEGLVSAGSRNEYFPVFYVEPYEGNEKALGFDLSSNAMRNQALTRARDTGILIPSGRITLVQEKGQQYGFLVILPIYAAGELRNTVEQRRANLTGYALGVFRIGDLIETTLDRLHAPSGLDFYVYDESADPQSRLLYARGPTSSPQWSRPLTESDVRTGLHTSRFLDIAGRTWTVVFKPAEGRFERESWAAWSVLTAGLLLTSMLVLYLISIRDRTRHIARRVTEQTAALESEVKERQQAETAARESQARLKAIIDHCPSSIYLKDLEGRFVLVNNEFESVNNLEDGAVVGKTVHDVYLKEWADNFAGHDREVIESRAAVVKEIDDEPRIDGLHSYLVVKFPVSDTNGEIVAIGGIETDITERKRTEQAIADREARTRAIVETVLDGIITIDDGGKIETFNPGATKMFGYEPGEVIGGNVSKLMPEPDRSAHDGYLRNYLATGIAKIIGIGREVVGQRKDGSVFPMELAVSPMRVEDRSMFTGIVRDITVRKGAEEALRQSHELLEQRVEERTIELTANNERLQTEIAERKKVEEALRERESRLGALQAELLSVSRLSAMGQLSSALAHELNQPLAAIMNYVQACRRVVSAPGESVSDKVVTMMDKTIDQASRASAIIRGLRDIVEKGETTRTTEDINEDVDQACALGLVGVESKGIEVQIDLGADLPPVLINRIQIQQVVVNLVRNAVEAVAGREMRRVMIKTLHGNESTVEVVVSDSGPGLSEEVESRLFEPFVTTKLEGMGIGLSISHSIIEAHGGKLWLAPTPGGGATFHFTVPIAPRDDADDNI